MSKASGYALGLVAIGLLVWIWAGGITGAATYFGLLSAGVAFALQDPMSGGEDLTFGAPGLRVRVSLSGPFRSVKRWLILEAGDEPKG